MVNLDALEQELSDRKARGLVLLEREFQLGEVPQSGGRTKLWSATYTRPFHRVKGKGPRSGNLGVVQRC